MLSKGIGGGGDNANGGGAPFESPHALSRELKLQHQQQLRASPMSSGKKSNAVAPMPLGGGSEGGFSINVNHEKEGALKAGPFVTSFPPKPMNIT